MSSQSVFGGPMMAILVVILGFFSLFEPIVFFLFFAVLGYYLYRLDKRLTQLEEGHAPPNNQLTKKPKEG